MPLQVDDGIVFGPKKFAFWRAVAKRERETIRDASRSIEPFRDPTRVREKSTKRGERSGFFEGARRPVHRPDFEIPTVIGRSERVRYGSASVARRSARKASEHDEAHERADGAGAERAISSHEPPMKQCNHEHPSLQDSATSLS
jgi:hypothetical protein